MIYKLKPYIENVFIKLIDTLKHSFFGFACHPPKLYVPFVVIHDSSTLCGKCEEILPIITPSAF